MHSDSVSLFESAQRVIPGGVNSPVRNFAAVGGEPPFIRAGEGAYVIDENNKRYVDYVCCWGANLFGHAHPTILDAVNREIIKGLGFGAPTVIEVEMATTITRMMPAIEKVRMVNSGTEATMSALRLARGVTSRDKIIKFAGCYHGHVDALLVKAGSGALTFGQPSSPGIPADFTKHTLIAEYNHLASVEELFKQYPSDISAIILEPIAGNMNMVPATAEFISGCRKLCDQYGALFIIDEVMTGFRVASGGAQSLYGVEADITCLGKVIGGGLPVGAFGGRAAIMDQLSPLGSIYQAGTLSGNHVAMGAGLAALNLIEQSPNLYTELNHYMQQLQEGFTSLAAKHSIQLQFIYRGGMFGLFFTDQKQPIIDFAAVTACDKQRFIRFFHGMLQQGIYLAPSMYEAGFITASHGEQQLRQTLDAADAVFATL